MASLFRADPRADRPLRAAIWLAWLAVALWLASHHVFWRDEVRAFTLALSGEDTMAMLRRIQGEGHPALWYLLLRGLHALTGTREALPLAAFGVGAAATALFAWRAPFRPVVIALTLFGAFALFEYVVVARNYGIAVLLMFAFAAAYARGRERGIALGLILALLCNTNVPAVLLAGGLGLFWGMELLESEGWRWTPRWRHFLINMGLALAGVVACIATVYPPYNDAVTGQAPAGLASGHAVLNALDVATAFRTLAPQDWAGVPFPTALVAILILGSIAGLIRSAAATVAGLFGCLALCVFFQLVYPGSYRHAGLFLAFLLTLHWLIATRGGESRSPLLERWGGGALAALLLMQVVLSVLPVSQAWNGVPFSRAQALGALLAHEGLGRAVVLGDPDVMLESLAYYAGNPIWLEREHRWGQVPAFTRASRVQLSLGGMLNRARVLRARTGRPVVVVMQGSLDPVRAENIDRGFLGNLSTTPATVRAFTQATRRLASFAPAVTDESYDVYLLR